MDSLVEMFCHVDDFCQAFLPIWQAQLLASGAIQRQRPRSLCMSEIMTILIAFHQSHYRDFKAYYCQHVLPYWRSDFPGLVSYQRFIDYTPSALVPLAVYLRTCCLGSCTGISFMDSTPLVVCHNARIHNHKVFAGLAARGHSSTGWFFGFKLHLVFNDRGELLDVMLSPGNVDDRKPVPFSRQTTLRQDLRRQRLSIPALVRISLPHLLHPIDHQAQIEHEEPLDALGRSPDAAETSHCRVDHRSAQKYLSGGAFPTSQCIQLSC